MAVLPADPALAVDAAKDAWLATRSANVFGRTATGSVQSRCEPGALRRSLGTAEPVECLFSRPHGAQSKSLGLGVCRVHAVLGGLPQRAGSQVR